MSLPQMIRKNLFWRGLYYFSYFLLNVGIARVFEAEGSGKIFLIINNLQIVLMVASIGLPNGIMYFSSSHPASRPLLSRLSMLWSILATLLVVPVLHWFYPFDHGIEREVFSMYYVFPYLCGIMLSTFFTSMLISEGDYTMPSLVPLLINVVLLILLPFEGNPVGQSDIQWYERIFFLAFLVQGIAMAVVYLLRYRKQKAVVPHNEPAEKPILEKIFKYSLVSLVANLAFFLLNKIDFLFVAAYETASALGNYIQVSRMGQLFILIPTTFAAVILPETARGRSVHASIIFLGKAMLVLLMGFFLVILFWGDSIFRLLLGESFTNMRIPFLILLPGIYFLSVHALLAAYFGGKGTLHINIISSVAALIIMIAGDILFIPVYGINGAAAVSTVSYWVCLVISYRYYMKEHPSGFISFFLPTRRDIQKMAGYFNPFKK